MKGPLEIQAIVVLKWRREAWKRREKNIFLEEQNCVEGLQYSVAIKVMSACCQFGLIQSTNHSNILRTGKCCDTRHADIWLR